MRANVVVVAETAKDVGTRCGDGERAGVSTGIDIKANAWAAAHSRMEICVSLRMAASAEAPLSPMQLL